VSSDDIFFFLFGGCACVVRSLGALNVDVDVDMLVLYCKCADGNECDVVEWNFVMVCRVVSLDKKQRTHKSL